MTPAQKRLARHALGLPNKRKQSYRNYFTAGKAHPAHPDWLGMVAAGDATTRAKVRHLGGDDIFWLTRQGAEAALEPGETLCPEDFPPVETEATDA